MRYLLLLFLVTIINAQTIKTNLRDFKSPSDAIIYLDSLPKNQQNRYDVLILRIQAFTALENFDNALQSAQKLQNTYPKSIEAKEMVANILFWQKKFDESLKIFKKLLLSTKNNYYYDRIKIIQNAKLEYIKKNNITHFDTNSSKTTNNSIEIGEEKFTFSDHRYTETREYIQTVFPISDLTTIAAMENISKYDMNDKNIRSEIYAKFEEKKWGYLSLSASPTYNFMPKFSIGGHIYKGLNAIEVGCGYEFMKYKNNNVSLIVPEYRYEFGNDWYINQKFYYVLDNQSFAIANEIGKTVPDLYKYAFLYTYTDSNEQSEILNTIKNTTMHQIAFLGEYRFDTNWGIGANISFEQYKDTQNGNKFEKKGGNISIRRYW